MADVVAHGFLDRNEWDVIAERQHQASETAPRAGADLEHAALAGVPPPPKHRRGALAIGDIGPIEIEQVDRLAGHDPAKHLQMAQNRCDVSFVVRTTMTVTRAQAVYRYSVHSALLTRS